MIAGGFFWHLLRTLRRSLRRVAALFLITGLIAAVTVELAAIIATGQFPSPWTHIIAAILGVVVGYGVSVTMLTTELIRDLVITVEDMAKDVRKELTASGKVVTDFARSYEQRRA